MPAGIRVFRCLTDNIGVLVRDLQTGACMAIDAPDATEIVKHLDAAAWKLTDILVTHSHSDHVQGIAELKQRYGCRVVVPEKAADTIPLTDETVKEGDHVTVGSLSLDVWETPGHCSDHVSYIMPGERIAFVGDVLFTLGCGRVFGGDYKAMWHSLVRLQSLPDETQIFCGHDYTLSNGRFALAVDPGNARLKARVAEAEQMARGGGFMVPTRLGDERASNPFLRAGEPALARAVGKESSTPFEVFKALREWKNSF